MVFQVFRQECMKLLKDVKIKKITLEEPPNEIADLAFPCFLLSKEMKRNPNEIAKELEDKINKKIIKKKESLIREVKAVGPYLNFYINWNNFNKLVLTKVIKDDKKYGFGRARKEKIMVEYCHANTHKAFHIGHVRNICLGEAFSRILEAAGYRVIRANYQGDIGMHVAKCLWGYINLFKGREPKKDKGKWLGDVYATASKKIKDNAKLKEKVEEVNRRLYSGDKKLLAIWKKTRQWSLDYLNNIYKDFGVRFDRFYFESEVEKQGIKIAKELLKKGIAKMSDGAIIMNLERFGLGIFLLLKRDGTPLYSTKDLYLAQLQDKEYKPDKIIHVVGSEQRLYFKQLFKTFELINKLLAAKEEHLCYELVILKSGKMASRLGIVVLYDDFKNDLIRQALVETKKRNPGWGKRKLEKTAKIIALGALKYGMLNIAPNKTIVFDPKQMLAFEGDTGPYLQYTHARACSILRKSKIGISKIISRIDAKRIGDKEQAIMKKISKFPLTIESAARDYKPHYIANYLYELATLFNEFYHSHRVIGSEKEKERLALTNAVRIVLRNGLALLGIEAPDEM